MTAFAFQSRTYCRNLRILAEPFLQCPSIKRPFPFAIGVPAKGHQTLPLGQIAEGTIPLLRVLRLHIAMSPCPFFGTVVIGKLAPLVVSVFGALASEIFLCERWEERRHRSIAMLCDELVPLEEFQNLAFLADHAHPLACI
ncbi:hypothetical protein MOV76_08045 [Rhizobium sp. PRIMUS64]|uniref:hypothetical protein n=1 Tax=Rhizobium sp. PRIMUS64 TaxID=2908925 RepID=UPI001FF68F8B|nr:hypothetical protein [Rhizobium sp. PRIMUS64]MCJ9691586.1 hypothetical protein [Rhizobium sp. PRIMUS64]